MQIKAERNSYIAFQYLIIIVLIILVLFLLPQKTKAQAPPINDNCLSAIDINSIDRYAIGSYTSTSCNVKNASLQIGEFFPSALVSSGNDKKSVWYKFTIATTRAVRVELKQPIPTTIGESDAGFTVYKTTSCLPNASAIAPAKLTPLNKFGNTFNECVTEGTYYIQVGCKQIDSGSVFIQLDVNYPYNSVSFDNGLIAYDFGSLANENSFYPNNNGVEIDLGCYSIDDSSEPQCNDLGANSNEYTQTIWEVFTTDSDIDALRYEIYCETANAIGKVGANIYSGNAITTPISALSLVGSCNVIQTSENSWQGFTLPCSLPPNTTYSIQLFVHKDTISKRMYSRIGHVGRGTTLGFNPVSLPANNKLGTISTGNTVYGTDNLSCGAWTNCGTVSPSGGVVYNGTTYNYNTWYTFTISTASKVTINTQDYTLKRLFSGNVNVSCNLGGALTTTTANSFESYCLPAGTYSLQILGSYNQNNVLYTPYSQLGASANIAVSVVSATAGNQFDLDHIADVDKISNLNELADGITYTATNDRFGCDNTSVPNSISMCSVTNTKASYRVFTVGDADGDGSNDEGILTLTNGNDIFRYGLWNDNAITQAQVATFPASPPSTITLNNEIVKCVSFSWNSLKTCLVPGTYSLVTMANDAGTELSDQPKLKFDIVKTQYNNPTSPYEFGDITATMQAVSSISNVDVFDCTSNLEIVGGLSPCSNSYSKLIYRQFYVSQPSRININSTHLFRLFKGKVSDVGINNLVIYDAGNTNCVSYFTTGTCTLLPAGWYTIVSYGTGGTYTGTVKYGGDIGLNNNITISGIALPSAPLYNRPANAYNAGTTNYGTNSGTSAYPNYERSYTFGTEHFNCVADTPFISHPITSCNSSFNRVAYYTFQITNLSYVNIGGIPETMQAKVFDFSCLENPANLTTATPIQPCITSTDIDDFDNLNCNSWDGKIEFCNLPAGKYTIVVFASDAHIGSELTPVLYVNKIENSRFDYASTAYDFGLIPGDNVNYYNNPSLNDVNPLNTGRKASTDFFSCNTSANIDDPISNICYSGQYPNSPQSIGENIRLYNGSSTDTPARRNLWYSFKQFGSGRVYVSVYNKTTGKTSQAPFAIYQSNNLALGDSTIAQGLVQVQTNATYDFNYCIGCRTNQQSVFFDVSPCLAPDTNRYYIIVDNNAYNYPNSQVEVSVRFDDVTPLPTMYDYYSTAYEYDHGNSLVGGIYVADQALFACATPDQILLDRPAETVCDASSMNSLWYKFNTDIAGKVRINYLIDSTTRAYMPNEVFLYKEIVAGDSTEIGLQYQTSNTVNQGGYSWGESCLSPGTYYFLLSGCNYSIEKVQPYLWIVPEDGDLCSQAISMSLNGAGTVSASSIINCHSIGQDYGESEQNPNMGCLFGPSGYKSTWFKISALGTDKLDLSFSLSENTTAFPTEIRYRFLYGTCGAMTAGTCNNDAGTEFTVNCMEANNSDYFIQVETPLYATGTIVVTATGTVAPNPTCVPLNPLLPIANFTLSNSCMGDESCFQNMSTAGTGITYAWDFGDGSSASTSINPCHTYPTTSNESDVYNVKLVVTNIEAIPNIKDSVIIPITIYKKPNPNITRVPSAYMIISGTALQYSANTTNITSPLTTYLWDFGGGVSSVDENPNYTFPNNMLGLQIVSLIATNGTCSQTDTNHVLIGLEPVFNGGDFDGQGNGTLSANCPLEAIFNGGDYDGNELGLATAMCSLEAVFNGGDYDGHSNNVSIASCPLETIFNGGNFDGADKQDFNISLTTSNLTNDSICAGSSMSIEYQTLVSSADSSMWNASPYSSNPWTTSTLGDFKSKKVSGNWSDYNSWLRYNGTAWVAATSGQIPTATSKVEISVCANLTVDNSVSVCKDLIVSGALFSVDPNLLNIYGTITTRKNTTAMPAWATNDYRSAATGNWNTTSTWERYNGSAWVAAAAVPNSSTAKVWIQDGHTVTITSAFSCKLLYIPGTGKLVDSGTPWLTINDAWPNNAYPNANFMASKLTVTPSTTTRYICNVKTIAGCDYHTEDVLVTVVNLPVANAGLDVTLCNNENSVIGTSGVAGYVYSWLPVDGLNDPNIPQPIASPTNTTTYTLSVSDQANLCTSVNDNMVYTVNTMPVIDAGADILTCSNLFPIDLTSTGTALNWDWYKLDSVAYKQPVYVTNPNSDLTNFQVKIVLNTATLISANKMRSDCGDLRVFDTDGTTSLNYWIVDGTCNTASTEIWVKVPSLPSSSSALVQPLSDANLSSSSMYDASLSHIYSRLNSTVQNNWVPGTQNQNQWIKADFGSVKTVNKIATQGRHSAAQWVTSYKISYSNDNTTWTYLGGSDLASATIFTGNTDQNTVVENSFTSFSARYVRLHPWTWNSYQGLRWEIYQESTPSPKTINFTYGSSTLTTTSNGTNVFEFFDDFNGSTLNTQWTNTNGSSAPSVSGGKLMLNNADGNGVFASGYKIQENSIAESYVTTSNTSNYGSPLRFTILSNAWVNDGSSNITDILWYGGTFYSEVHSSEQNIGARSTGYHKYQINYRTSNTSNNGFSIDGTAINNMTESSNTNNTLSPTIYSSLSSSNTMVDWFFIRKYSSIAPATQMGNELLLNAIANTQTCNDCGTSFESYLVIASNGACSIQDTVQVVDANVSSVLGLMYRTRANGNWTNISTWEVSDDNGVSWVNATSYGACGAGVSYPTSQDQSITIRHHVDYDFSIPNGIDECVINLGGLLTINDGVTCLIVDSSSAVITNDLIVNGILSINASATIERIGLASILNNGRVNTANSSFNNPKIPTNALTNTASSTVNYSNGDQPMWNGTYGKLEISGGGYKTLTGTQTYVATNVNFISGFIKLNNRNIRLADVCTITGADNSKYVITNDLGELIRNSCGATSNEFPVGYDNTGYSMLVITNNGTVDNYGVRISGTLDNDANFSCDALNLNSAVNRTWYISEATTGGSTLNLTFYWNTNQENVNFSRSQCYVGNYENLLGWNRISSNNNANVGVQPWNTNAIGISNLGAFAVGSCNLGKYKYRTVADGLWTDETKWEIYLPSQSAWYPPSSAPCTCGPLSYPTSADSSIQVLHNISFNQLISSGVDELIVESSGVLTISSGIDLNIMNGPNATNATTLNKDLRNIGKIIIKGTLTLESGSEWVNDDASIVHYQGNSQTLYNVSYGHLWIDANNSTVPFSNSYKTLAGSGTTVKSGLKFIHGIVNLENYNINLNANALLEDDNQLNGWVKADGLGSFVWTYPSGSNVVRRFPIGGVYYSPATINFNMINGSGTLLGRVNESAHPLAPSTPINRYWTFDKGTIDFSGNYTMNLFYDNFDLPYTPSNTAEEQSMVEIGGAYNPSYTEPLHWRLSPNTIPAYSVNVLSNNSGFENNAFSDFTLMRKSTVPLDVSWISFNGKWANGFPLLYWATASERDNYGFEIYRSYNGREFDKIGFIPGNGNSNQIQNYQFSDNSADFSNGIAYYQLKQIDYSGNIYWSQVIPFALNAGNLTSSNLIEGVYPNPIKDGELLNVLFRNNNDGNAQIEMINVDGQLVYKEIKHLTRGNLLIVIPVNNLLPGVYLLRIVIDGKSFAKKVIVS